MRPLMDTSKKQKLQDYSSRDTITNFATLFKTVINGLKLKRLQYNNAILSRLFFYLNENFEIYLF